MMYCPSHKSIYENEMAHLLADVAAKKASHLPPKIDSSMSDVKIANSQMTIEKWARR